MKTSSLILASFLACAPAWGAPPENPCKGGGGGKIFTVDASGKNSRIQDALKKAQPGDTVLVKPGKYRGGISFPRSGTAGACISLKGEKGAVISGGSTGIFIANKNYISVTGLTISDISGGDTPTGIRVTGSASHIELRDNIVRNVKSSSNAHAISFYGSHSKPMSNLFIEGNEIYNCKLGQSEALVLNGNVEKFLIAKNKVHDNDNIGIDIIGFEGTGPSGKDFARSGYITGNKVWNISSGKNPTYGGERSAGGIYVDGGSGILIENNQVSNSDIGIEVASEKGGKTTRGVIVRGNTLSNSYQGNLMVGGYAASKGRAAGIEVEGNTFTTTKGSGEIILQHNVNGIVIRGNKFGARAKGRNIASTGSNNCNILIEGNQYSVKPRSGDLAAKEGQMIMLGKGCVYSGKKPAK